MSEEKAFQLLALIDNAAQLLQMKSPDEWTIPENSFMRAAQFMWENWDAWALYAED